jgi:hypothetical protein
MNKKLTLYSLLCILLLVGQSFAIVRTEEVIEWTKDTVGTYFNKYKIFYDKKSDKNSLIDIAKSYKDAATSNAQLFGSSVDSIISGFTNSVQKHSHLAQNDFDAFITNLRHELRRLELKGQLNKEHVKAVLDKARFHALRHKIMTEAEWNKAYSVFHSIYEEPTWYQRVLRLKPEVDDGASSFNKWVQSVTDRVNHIGGLTKEQTKAIGDQLRTSISKSDIRKLGDKHWVDDFTKSVSKKTELKKDQLEEVIESVKKDVNGYKIFALDYTGQAKDHAKNWMEQIKSYFEDLWDTLKEHFMHWNHVIQSKLRIRKHEATKVIPHKATASIKSVVHSLHSDWEASSKSKARSRSVESIKTRVYDAASQVTDKINNIDLEHLKKVDLKDSFGHFWRQKEHDAYRKLGYTEAHIDWIQDYLTKTFKNQKTSVKGRADEAAIAIKRYLDELHVQSPDQVDANVHKLKRHLESWRTLIN